MSNSSQPGDIKLVLVGGSTQEKLRALQSIDARIAKELFDQISALTFHYRPEIRLAALGALRSLDQSYLVDIIRETLRDENRDVRRAASELFHLNDIAA